MAAHSLSFSLLSRTRAPLLLRLLRPRRQRFLPAGSAALATRGFCSSAPSRPRGALLGARGRRQRGGVGSRTMSSSTNSTMAVESALAERAGDVEMLPFVNDKHGGVIVEMTTPMDPQVFSASLKASLSKWREQGIRGVWIKLPISLSNLIQPTVEEGFWYHHAEETYLMLAYWLPNTTHTLPVNATHRVGVGAFVMNDKREVLAVQEKSGVLRGLGVWKFPTGVVEPGEDINIGAIREVKEETGIDTEFVEVLAFRSTKKMASTSIASSEAVYDPKTDPKRKAKSNDPGWKYDFWPVIGNRDLVQCSLCDRKVSGRIKRFKEHLAGGFGDVQKCAKTTTAIMKEMRDALWKYKKGRPLFLNCDAEGEDEDVSVFTTDKESQASVVQPSFGTADM